MQLHRGPPTPLGSSPNNTCPFNHNILLLLPLLLPTCQTKIVISGQREHHFHLHHTEAWLGRSAWWRRRVCACLSLIGWGLGREDKTDLFTRTAEGQIKSIYVEEIQYVFSRPCKTADPFITEAWRFMRGTHKTKVIPHLHLQQLQYLYITWC